MLGGVGLGRETVVLRHDRHDARRRRLLQMWTGRLLGAGVRGFVDAQRAAVAAAMPQRRALVDRSGLLVRLCLRLLTAAAAAAQRLRSDADVLRIEAIEAVQRNFALFRIDGRGRVRCGGDVRVGRVLRRLTGGAVLARERRMGVGGPQVMGIGGRLGGSGGGGVAQMMVMMLGVCIRMGGDGGGGGGGVGNELC